MSSVSLPALQSPTTLLLSLAGILICHKVVAVYQSIKAMKWVLWKPFILAVH
jgi:hypothetical protein